MTATASQINIPGSPPMLGRELARFAQLDGIRAVAILLVLFQHLLPLHLAVWALFPETRGLRPGQVVPPLGFMGVALFFVLSGFLITRILLAARERIDAGESGTWRQVGVFYGRRALRIFPVFYVTLLVLWLLGVRQIDERIVWHALYLSNWLFANPVVYGEGGFDRHFWSLAVEEQFYLLWPWLMLFLPRRLLGPALVLTFLAGPAWRAWFSLRGWPWQWHEFPTPANLDLLAGGGLLAYVWNTPARRWMLWVCVLAGIPLAAVAVGLFRTDWMIQWRVVLNPTMLAMAYVGIVGLAAQGIPGPGRLLASRPIVYVGTISYGMYVVHNFMPEAVRIALGQDTDAWLIGALSMLLTFLVAAVSWHVMEKPLNGLKRHLPYA